jgi:hypothetical protein
MLSQRIVCAALAGFFLVCPASAQSQKGKRKNMKRKKPSITQTMTNSPGGIQAAGNVTVNQGLQPRKLTAQQRALLIAALESFLQRVPKGPVKVTAVFGDGESIAFAEELTGVLEVAGWKIDSTGQSTFAPKVPVGLFVMVHSRETAPLHGAALQRAFAAAGMPIGADVYSGVPIGVVELLVGRQP